MTREDLRTVVRKHADHRLVRTPGGLEQALALERGEVKAIDDKCSHGEISLSEGFVDDETIECWAHGAKFSLETGAPLSLPAYEPVAVYETFIENGIIFLEYEA